MKTIRQFLYLEWNAFKRSPTFETNLAIKILMGLVALYFIAIFLALGVGVFFIAKDVGAEDPLVWVNKFMIYYLAADLFMRYSMQKMPITRIKQLLLTPLNKNQIIRFSLLKSSFSFFNIIHLFFLIPFSVVLIAHDYSIFGVLSWFLGVFLLILSSNYLNVFVNSSDRILYIASLIYIVLAVSHYMGYFDITLFTAPFFDALYQQPLYLITPVALLLFMRYRAVKFFTNHMFLDSGLAQKEESVRNIDFDFLKRLGSLGNLLTNDMRMIVRNKRPKQAVIAGIAFLFYGLLFYTDSIEAYEAPVMKMFAGIFVTGGFLFMFGSYVPSWDSAYYPLLMTQNLSYKDYLKSKWALVVFAVIFSTILSSLYLFISLEAFGYILAGGFFNLGLNAYLVIFSGAFVKVPVDLTSGKKPFGDTQAMNTKTMLLSLPKILFPIGVYALGYYTVGNWFGITLLILVSLLGLLFHNKILDALVKLYKREKYDTLASYTKN